MKILSNENVTAIRRIKGEKFSFPVQKSCTYNNFEISLVLFMPNITTDHAITYTNTGQTGRFIVCSSIAVLCESSSDDPPQRTAVKQMSRFTVWING